MKKVLAGLGVARENTVFVSGIGCSSRFPYYINTYGFHTIHGRAPTFATGLKLARPDLQVWVVTGDGDGLSIGGNHLMHALRRNIDIKIDPLQQRDLRPDQGAVFARPRASAPSRSRRRPARRSTRCAPCRSPSPPRRPSSPAPIDVDINHLSATLQRAAAHRGSAFVEVYQNCNIFNDGVFGYARDKSVKNDNLLYLEHGRPMIFGKDRDRGIRLHGLTPEVVSLGSGIAPDDLLIHDERADTPTLAYLLSQMVHVARRGEFPRGGRRPPRRQPARRTTKSSRARPPQARRRHGPRRPAGAAGRRRDVDGRIECG